MLRREGWYKILECQNFEDVYAVYHLKDYQINCRKIKISLNSPFKSPFPKPSRLMWSYIPKFTFWFNKLQALKWTLKKETLNIFCSQLKTRGKKKKNYAINFHSLIHLPTTHSLNLLFFSRAWKNQWTSIRKNNVSSYLKLYNYNSNRMKNEWRFFSISTSYYFLLIILCFLLLFVLHFSELYLFHYYSYGWEDVNGLGWELVSGKFFVVSANLMKVFSNIFAEVFHKMVSSPDFIVIGTSQFRIFFSVD